MNEHGQGFDDDWFENQEQITKSIEKMSKDTSQSKKTSIAKMQEMVKQHQNSTFRSNRKYQPGDNIKLPSEIQRCDVGIQAKNSEFPSAVGSRKKSALSSAVIDLQEMQIPSNDIKKGQDTYNSTRISKLSKQHRQTPGSKVKTPSGFHDLLMAEQQKQQ